MTRILLVGSQGQVGQAILEKAYLLGQSVIACDKHQCDITNISAIRDNLEKHQPDIVINCAAFTQVDKAELPCEKNNVWLINAKGPENLAKLCSEYGCLMLHLSTDYVFDGLKKTPYQETDKPCPISEYGKSKLAGEEAVIQHAKNFIILRVSWVFSEYAKNPLKNLVKLMRSCDHLNMVSDQIACPTYAGDIAEILLTLSRLDASRITSGVYHYCNTPAITRFDLADTVRQYLNLKKLTLMPILTAEYPTPAMRPKNAVLDCELFTRTYGIAIKPWERSLKSCLEKLS